MDDRTQLAADLLDVIRGAFWKRSLITRESVKLVDAQSRYVARMEGDLLAPDRARVGNVRVVVSVPSSPSDPVSANVRWRRSAYGFWFERTVSLGPLVSAADADLTDVEMALTMVGWAASGSVPLKSMIRTIRKVRTASWWE